MIDVDKTNFEEEVLKSAKPVLVDFWGPGCGRCIQMMPQIEELESKHGERVKFVKLNIQGNRRLAIREQVSSLPTVLLYENGVKIASFEGNFSIDDIGKKIEEWSGSGR